MRSHVHKQVKEENIYKGADKFKGKFVFNKFSFMKLMVRNLGLNYVKEWAIKT